MKNFELIIIGGGPAGLRAGEIAGSCDIDYIILEKGGIAGAWRSIRPEMIMLSPCHPQRDWTSISPRFPIWRMDVQRPFCLAGEFVNYLNEFYRSLNINIKIHDAVTTVKKENDLFKIETEQDLYAAPFLLVATGFLSNPYIPDIPGFRHNRQVIHAHAFRNAKDFRSKRVVIIGAGNSAAETALAICGDAQTYLYTRKKLKFFSKTRNLCHIRGLSESLLLELIRMKIIHYVPNSQSIKFENQVLVTNHSRLTTDYIICATGYRPHVSMLQDLSLIYNNKDHYPVITENGESVQIKNLFFGGPLARYRLSSQFIHGFVKKIPLTIHEIKKRLRNIY
jgi:thioredoxin reductase